MFASGHSVAWIVDPASGISTIHQAAKGKKVGQAIAGEAAVVSCSQRRLLEKRDLDARVTIIPIVDTLAHLLIEIEK